MTEIVKEHIALALGSSFHPLVTSPQLNERGRALSHSEICDLDLTDCLWHERLTFRDFD